MIRTIVVGADGSEGSRRAIAWAAGRAVELGAEVLAVLVLRPFGEFVMDVPPLPGHVITRLHDALEESWCKPLRDADAKYRSLVVEADPASGLLDVANREHADLLVLGAQGQGGVVHRVLGSVTYKVAHRAECPVVIVPAPRRESAEPALAH
jgi:nucleotide-binding universal stress UspA family protein